MIVIIHPDDYMDVSAYYKVKGYAGRTIVIYGTHSDNYDIFSFEYTRDIARLISQLRRNIETIGKEELHLRDEKPMFIEKQLKKDKELPQDGDVFRLGEFLRNEVDLFIGVPRRERVSLYHLLQDNNARFKAEVLRNAREVTMNEHPTRWRQFLFHTALIYFLFKKVPIRVIYDVYFKNVVLMFSRAKKNTAEEDR